MSQYPTFNFQLSLESKWLVKHIITKVSFKITIGKRYVYIDIRWPWTWNQNFNWKFEIMIAINYDYALISFATRLNSQNRNETEFINDLSHVISYRNVRISNWDNWIYGPRIWGFWLYISSLHDYRPPSTWKSLAHNTWCEM